jgi:hypothetical protein
VTARAKYYDTDLGKAQITVCAENTTPPPPPPPGNVKAWIDKPADGSTVSGTVGFYFGAYSDKEASLTANMVISDSSGLSMVSTFSGKSNGKDNVVWEYKLDTTTLGNGKISACLEVYADNGAAGRTCIAFKVDNSVTPPPPPPPPPGNITVQIASPKEGDIVSGTITVTGRTYCEEKIRTIQVYIYIDGQEYTQVFSSGGGWSDFTFQIDTTKLTNAGHTIGAMFEIGGRTAKVSVNIVVKNGGTPPPPPPPPPPVIPDGNKNPDGSVDVEGTEVKFEAPSYSGMDNSSMTYTWEFGDGTVSHDKNPTHKYNQSGSYDVKLTVNDGTTQKESSLDLNVGKTPLYTTRVPGFGAEALVLGLIIGCVATFFRCRK